MLRFKCGHVGALPAWHPVIVALSAALTESSTSRGSRHTLHRSHPRPRGLLFLWEPWLLSVQSAVQGPGSRSSMLVAFGVTGPRLCAQTIGVLFTRLCFCREPCVHPDAYSCSRPAAQGSLWFLLSLHLSASSLLVPPLPTCLPVRRPAPD